MVGKVLTNAVCIEYSLRVYRKQNYTVISFEVRTPFQDRAATFSVVSRPMSRPLCPPEQSPTVISLFGFSGSAGSCSRSDVHIRAAAEEARLKQAIKSLLLWPLKRSAPFLQLSAESWSRLGSSGFHI